MKKIFIGLAALLPLLFSCGKPQNTEDMLAEPHFVQYAGQLIPRSEVHAGAEAASTKAGLSPVIVDFLELTESGLYAIGLNEGGRCSYHPGSYTVSGTTYNLSGFGSVSFSGESDMVELTIAPDGGEAYTVKALLIRGSGTDPVCRGWTVDRTRVKVGNGAADFSGFDLGEIGRFLRSSGYDIPNTFPSGRVTSVSLTNAGSIIFAYSDGSADVASCNKSGSTISYNWMERGMGFSVDDGSARLEKVDGKYVLTLSAVIGEGSGSIALVLSPMD